MMIWCLSCNDQKRGIWMTVPRSARPCTWLDKRTVHFNKYGHDIRDESYSKCLPWAPDAPAIIPKDRFLTAGNKGELIWLWEQVTHLNYDLVELVSRIQLQFNAATRNYGAAGERIPPIVTPTQNFTPHIDQPHENDAMWLLKEYINFHYPNGGNFWTGSKDNFPNGNADMERFLR